MENTIRWSVTVSREVDRSLRSTISKPGPRAGSISRFVEHAARKELFGRALDAVRARNAQTSPEVIETAISAAIRAQPQRRGCAAHWLMQRPA